jgi:protein-tyrosine-phosphatase
MAEVIARQLLAEHVQCLPRELEGKGFRIASAGTGAFDGEAASPEAVIAMAAHGLDLEDHRSQMLTLALAKSSDVIWTMTMSHLPAVRQLGPDIGRKACRLDPDADIPDPIGQSVEVYEDTAEAIRSALDRRFVSIFEVL